jgi:hypothetical protein
MAGGTPANPAKLVEAPDPVIPTGPGAFVTCGFWLWMRWVRI